MRRTANTTVGTDGGAIAISFEHDQNDMLIDGRQCDDRRRRHSVGSQQDAGHKDMRTTANQHGQLFPERRREMAGRMGRLILSEALSVANWY